jgi:thiol:disulfide interchange protein DsbD
LNLFVIRLMFVFAVFPLAFKWEPGGSSPFVQLGGCALGQDGDIGDLFSPVGSSSAVDQFTEPLEGLQKIEPAHVVRFRVLSLSESAGGHKLSLVLQTRGGFKIYDQGLRFVLRGFGGQDSPLQFQADPPPENALDPWYQEMRATHGSGGVFTVQTGRPLVDGDILRIRFEACSVSNCLLPVWFEVLPYVGQGSRQVERAERFRGEKDPSALRQQASPIGGTATAGAPVGNLVAEDHALLGNDGFDSSSQSSASQEDQRKDTQSQPEMSVTDEVTVFVQKALFGRSIWLFPALFLAGLLMNLTPCVYPMIPITLNVLGRLGHQRESEAQLREHWLDSVFRSFLYLLGIVLTYSAMGVLAGMTGTLFGSLLQSPFVLVGLAVLFVLLGFGMLGVIDFTRIQNWAARIPVSERSPHLGVFTMGAVSGLVSAPCTGPVLSAILVLIGQSQDPLYGFSLMAFFSFGFGSPYLILGMFAHNLKRLPRAGWLLDLVKIVFAALLFGLAGYYLKPVVGRQENLEWIYYQPPLGFAALLFIALVVIGFVLQRGPVARRILRPIFIVTLSVQSLWLALFITKGFSEPPQVARGPEAGTAAASGVQWLKDWRQARQQAEAAGKGLVVDAWAEWCAACVKMDKELWILPEVGERLGRQYVAVKLDFTESSPFTDEIAERWDISALPAVALFPPGSDFEGQPVVLFRQEIKKPELFAALDRLVGWKPSP